CNRFNLYSQDRLNEQENCGGGPRLGRTSDGISHRTGAVNTSETAKQLGQAILHKETRFEQAAEDLAGAIFIAIAREAGGDQRVSVRPDRPVMIRHRIETSRRRVEGAHAPSGKRLLVHERISYTAGLLDVGNASVKARARVRSSDPAFSLLAVQRKRKSRNLFAPKRLMKIFSQLRRLV